MKFERDPNKLFVYTEGRKRRALVGTLIFIPEKHGYAFEYDENYFRSRRSIPLGPDLSLAAKSYMSPKLFPSFLDRIPDQSNAAYADYCAAQGISINERNPIILLGTIGKRGPSSFVFESVYISNEDILFQFKQFRRKLNLSFHDISLAFGINELSLLKFENGSGKDKNVVKLITIFLNFKDVSLSQLRINGGRLHQEKLFALTKYFQTLQP